MTQKVKDMLDSEDIEMVRLGVHLMKQEIKEKKEWAKILGMFQMRETNPNYPDLYIKKWDWEIKGEEIIILTLIYYQERNIKLLTGAAGKKLFDDALKKQGFII